MDNISQTKAYIAALTGDPNSSMDWRVINDREKGVQAKNITGKFDDVYNQLVEHNQAGWGVFACVNALNGSGYKLDNISYIRSHVVDLDDVLNSAANYERAINSSMPPHFAVQTSPNKFHLYWLVEPYTGNDFYTLQQQKLAQFYNGDKHVIDATRVLRVPGFYHCKAEPVLVTCWGLHQNPRYTAQQIQDHLAGVNVAKYISTRKPLGDPELQAPSLDRLKQALSLINPNDLDRQKWLSISAAFKQAGWNHASDEILYYIWKEWCGDYEANDEKENQKLWQSLRDTQVGWKAFEYSTPIKAYSMFSNVQPLAPVADSKPIVDTEPTDLHELDRSKFPHELLSAEDCREWFKNCFFVERTGEIFSPTGRFMKATQFNGRYGGKEFIIRENGKTTDEPWKAALRSTRWTIPKVDHVRFLPSEPSLQIVHDAFGRKGLNTYIKPKIKSKEGDVTPWFRHVEKILPNASDRKIFLDYMAHCIKYPGFKIPWAVLLQSVEGVGKTVFAEIMTHALGSMYIYKPKAPELIASGSKFNAWMRNKLCIIVDEIKIDERRELIEILKPMITDSEIEIQAKGVDQDMEDNCANWIFFSNYKDAIPVSQNGRRYAVFFSALQTKRDLILAGMDSCYFDNLFKWLRACGGLEAVTHWFQNYPIERGAIPVRAPDTSCQKEVLRIGRSSLEVILDQCIERGERGFRNGFVSVPVYLKAVKAAGIRSPQEHTVKTILNNKGYDLLGQTSRPVQGEDLTCGSVVYGVDPMMNPDDYIAAQNR